MLPLSSTLLRDLSAIPELLVTQYMTKHLGLLFIGTVLELSLLYSLHVLCMYAAI